MFDPFLQTMLDNPADDTSRLVYADWLEEKQDDPAALLKAEFLRLTVELATQRRKKGWRKAKRKRLQELASKLDTDWLAVVSKLRIENCHGANEGAISFDFVCNRQWQTLQPTDDRTVRICDGCQQQVHYCDTIVTARKHAWAGHCIAVDLGVIRRDGDLQPLEYMTLGMPSPTAAREEKERLKPDAVSAEREERKRAGQTLPH